jgi:hypothetical protein
MIMSDFLFYNNTVSVICIYREIEIIYINRLKLYIYKLVSNSLKKRKCLLQLFYVKILLHS